MPLNLVAVVSFVIWSLDWFIWIATLGRYSLTQIIQNRLGFAANQEITYKDGDPKFGCKHYKRRCQKRCPECKEFFSCRLCHDDVHFTNQMDPKLNHKLDRHKVTEIKCNECETVQKPQQNCEKCNI